MVDLNGCCWGGDELECVLKRMKECSTAAVVAKMRKKGP